MGLILAGLILNIEPNLGEFCSFVTVYPSGGRLSVQGNSEVVTLSF